MNKITRNMVNKTEKRKNSFDFVHFHSLFTQNMIKIQNENPKTH